ncbi:MAG TPA: AAA family ATPase [Polyangia bacterium]
MIVAVDGLDGSGKSRFAAALAAACAAGGVPATLVHVDDFRRDLDFSGLEAEAEAALYYERYYDLAALDARLAAFRDGGGLAIVEGIFTLRVPAVGAGAAVIALTVSPEEARRRILERDRAKGRSDEEITRRIARRYFPARARYRAERDPEARADAVVDNEDWRAPRLVRRSRGRFPAPIEQVLDGLAAIGG